MDEEQIKNEPEIPENTEPEAPDTIEPEEPENADNPEKVTDEKTEKQKKKEKFLANSPDWVMDYNTINEVIFCKQFVEKHPMVCVGGKLFDVDGEISSDSLGHIIGQEIMKYMMTGISKKVKAILEALKIYCYRDNLPLREDEIHLRNGTLLTDGRFTPEKYFCHNRLNVCWRDFGNEPYYPEHFLQFLCGLLENDDILTLQEYLGYCLIPSTRGQKMLFVIGSGGEGKSRIGIVLQEIFGKNMLTGSFQRIETDRFFRYNLQNKLLMIDDDMQLNALTSTGYIKNLITAETPIDVEAKGEQSHSAHVYARFLCFGNGSPKALYDKTDGFARRMMILTTKPKPENRVDDPYIAQKFLAEKEKIFRWMFDGLQRLLANHFRFTISDKTRRNIAEALSENCNILEFLHDEKQVVFQPEGRETSNSLYSVYFQWCTENALPSLKKDSFIGYLKANQKKLGIVYDNNVPTGNGKRVRGFKGIHLLFTVNL